MITNRAAFHATRPEIKKTAELLHSAYGFFFYAAYAVYANILFTFSVTFGITVPLSNA